MASFFFGLMILLLVNSTKAPQNFETVSDCPRNASSWKMKSDKKDCKGDTPNYLCAAIENQVGKYGEICTQYGLTPVKKCAVLNAQTYNLDSVDCRADSGCPQDPYIPSELWKYPICLKDFYGTKPTIASGTTETIVITDNINRNATQNGHRSGDAGSGAGVVVVVMIVLIIVIGVGILVVFYVRNQFGLKDKVQQSITDVRNPLECFQHRDDTAKYEKDEEAGVASGAEQPLLNVDNEEIKQKIQKLVLYFVQILKREITAQELKEKVVMHSKSIEEHFSVSIRKYLQSIQKVEDYGKLDTSLLYMLLRNFCGNIKPPNRGWDYEPLDNETSIGADVERIKSMWNKYCDGELNFKHLDDVYNRMKQTYGTVAEYEAGFDVVMDKIQSMKLNPDCTVEKGIVITENITTALAMLESRNVVILKGVIGCGKTHALKAIQNHFQGAAYVTEWMEENIKWQEGTYKEKPTIILCDNFFGRFGCSVFSQIEVIKTGNIIKAIENAEKNIKVVIAIHTHVYEEVKSNKLLKDDFLHQKNITVEMDKFYDAEALLIFKEQLKRGHCKMDPNCWFKNVGFQSVLDKLSKNQSHIGGPFLSLMYCNQHELFSDEAFSINPVQTMVQHFQRMKRDSSTLFDCLVYLMCVQQHNIEEEPKKWAGQMSAEISKPNLKNLAETFSLVQVESKKATPAHELLTTALIKCAAETKEIFLPMLQMCESDVFLQLLRPADSTHSELYFEYMFDSNDSKKYSRDVGKMCAYRLAQKFEKQEINHPLMTIELVNVKYSDYVKRDPKELHLI